VETVDLISAKSGNIGSTLISYGILKTYLPHEIVRCVEWFDNDLVGRTRKVGFCQAIPPSDIRTNVTIDHLHHPSNLENPDDVIYLHEWS